MTENLSNAISKAQKMTQLVKENQALLEKKIEALEKPDMAPIKEEIAELCGKLDAMKNIKVEVKHETPKWFYLTVVLVLVAQAVVLGVS